MTKKPEHVDKTRRKIVKVGLAALGLSLLGGLAKMSMDLGNEYNGQTSQQTTQKTPDVNDSSTNIASYSEAKKTRDFQPYFDAVLKDQTLVSELYLQRVSKIVWDPEKISAKDACKRMENSDPVYYKIQMKEIDRKSTAATFIPLSVENTEDIENNLYLFKHAVDNSKNEYELRVMLQHEGLHIESHIEVFFSPLKTLEETELEREMRFSANLEEIYVHSINLDYADSLGNTIRPELKKAIGTSFQAHYKSALEDARKIVKDKRYSQIHRSAAQEIIRSYNDIVRGRDSQLLIVNEDVGLMTIQLRASYLK